MGCLAGLGVFFFNLLLVVLTLPAYLIAKFSVLSACVKPMRANSWRRRAVLVSTCLAWRLALLLCCWIRTRTEGLEAFRAGLGKSGRSPVIVANHASFMDTILLVTFMPLAQISKIRMFVSNQLLKMPLLGTIVQAMGHMAVPFKSGSDSRKFEVDKEKMAECMQKLEAHLSGGGSAGWFPEGTMNRGDVAEVQVFRAGGFALAVHLDVEIWCVAYQGVTACWPAKAAVGGRPSRIGIKMTQLCESSHAHIADGNVDRSDEKAACIHLANTAHKMIQTGVSELIAEGYGCAAKSIGPDCSKPLLGA